MISIKDLHTVEDVQKLSDEEMFYIDRQLEDADFNNEELLNAFATEWVVRGM